MSHFNLKSLSFYGIAIGSVVLLFKVVTAYGETLKAPPPIDGIYRLNAQKLPKCLQSADLVLIIQQSGVYLNGVLLAIDKNSEKQNTSLSSILAEENPSLNGRFQNQKIFLSGTTNKLDICAKQVQTKIEAVANSSSLSGKISLNFTSQPLNFTAKKGEKQQPENKH